MSLPQSTTVSVSGWVQTLRHQKNIVFIILRDHSGEVQIVVSKKEDPALASEIEHLTVESAITVTGKIVLNKEIKLGGLEILPHSITIHSLAATPLPLASDSTLETQMDWRFLSIRSPKTRLIFEVQNTIEEEMRKVWSKEGFIEIHSPKLMSGASEGGAELFTLEYFKLGKAALAQSPQFYKQMAMASGLEKIFEIGPVFRANPSFTSRHDTEFTSVDVEMSWITSHEDIMKFEEEWLSQIIAGVKSKHGEAIKALFGVEVVVPSTPFPRVTMVDAQEIVMKSGYTPPSHLDLDPEGERRLFASVKETTGHEFVFVTGYHKEIRPFYHMRGEGELTNSFDLLWKGVEITTGAQREHRYETLCRQVDEKNIPREGVSFYLDFFKYGCPPHGGFGFGLSRMLMLLLGAKNVREVTYLYRGPNRLTP
jgi:nondiscriminating aspartyl-tRNA synthetase